MNYIEIEELIKVGAHFGHPTSKWNPKFSPYIATKKNGVHIIDLNETNRCLNKAVEELVKIVKGNGNVLFVGTKKQAKDVVQQAADKCGMYYIVERWLGGTLTNFGTIKRSIKRLFLLDKESSELYENLTKKEQHMLDKSFQQDLDRREEQIETLKKRLQLEQSRYAELKEQQVEMAASSQLEREELLSKIQSDNTVGNEKIFELQQEQLRQQ